MSIPGGMKKVKVPNVVSRLGWKWRKRSSLKIAERTYEKRAQAPHCGGAGGNIAKQYRTAAFSSGDEFTNTFNLFGASHSPSPLAIQSRLCRIWSPRPEGFQVLEQPFPSRL